MNGLKQRLKLREYEIQDTGPKTSWVKSCSGNASFMTGDEVKREA
jgi:hypothetical protein